MTPRSLQPIRSINDTDEFRRNYEAVEMVGGLHALDASRAGAGVTVGLIDDGAVNIAGELDGRIDPSLSRDFGDLIVGGRRMARGQIGDVGSAHGTPVANILAGAANGSNAMGYAPGTRLAILRIDDWDASSGTKSYTHVVEALDWARAKGLKLVNISLSSGASPIFGDAVSRFARTGGLLVIAAGNQGAADPADAAAIQDDARTAVLFVVALAPSIYSYMIEPYSNRAGAMAERTVAAPGSNLTTHADGSIAMFSGTSSAAPVVTALAATILSQWPQLSGQQAGEIILMTARDIGAPGPDPIFGRGIVDFEAALSPVAPALSNGKASTSVAGAVMSLPASLNGDRLRALLSDVIVLDRFGRDFRGSIADRIITDGPQALPLRRRIALAQDRHDTGLQSGNVSIQASFVAPAAVGADRPASLNSGTARYARPHERLEISWNSLAGADDDFTVLAAPGDAIRAFMPRATTRVRYARALGRGWLVAAMAGGGLEARGAWSGSLAWQQESMSIQLAAIEERGSVLGTSAGFGSLRLGRGARTIVLEFAQSHRLRGDWDIAGYASVGMTRIAIDPTSLVTGAGPLIGTRFGLQARGPLLGGIADLGMAQPLSIRWGSVELTRAIGYDRTLRRLDHAVTRVSVAGGRGVQLAAGYTVSDGRSIFRLGLLHDRDERDTSALLSWRLGM